MKISVVIPAYNSAATISETLDSVKWQTVPADEVLVMDDGSKDATAEIVKRHPVGATLLKQKNSGVAAARNALCKEAKGDLIAFLDSDDLWHPRYLETQSWLYREHPDAVALFTGHFNLFEGKVPSWQEILSISDIPVGTWQPLQFLRSYDLAPGRFACLSHCCVPKRVFDKLGDEPFRLRRAEDLYFTHRMILHSPGTIVSTPVALSAYRVREGALSSDRLAINAAEVEAFTLLNEEFEASASDELKTVFRQAFKMKRRIYAKTLLSAGKVSEARHQLSQSLRPPFSVVAGLKSLGLLAASYLPKSMQPNWPPVYRDIRGAA